MFIKFFIFYFYPVKIHFNKMSPVFILNFYQSEKNMIYHLVGRIVQGFLLHNKQGV